MSALCGEHKNCFPPRPAANMLLIVVFSKSPKELAKKKPNNCEETRVWKFQWNWPTVFPWLRANMRCLSSDEQYDISYPYPQLQPPTCYLYSLFCDVCPQQLQSSSGTDLSKNGTKAFKMDSPKKHDKSQAHASCIEALKARQNPQETLLLQLLNKAFGYYDAKLKKIQTAFTIVALERPFDDYETVPALQNINGADLDEMDATRSVCTEFLHNISDVMKEEMALKLKNSNFISVLADGGTDKGVMEEVLVYVRYLDMELGKLVNEYLAI